MSGEDLVARLQAILDEREQRYTDQLHERRAHPDYEYLLDVEDETPEGVWEPNVPAGDKGAEERWAYQEESYWRRLRAGGTPGRQRVDAAVEGLRLVQAHRDILAMFPVSAPHLDTEGSFYGFQSRDCGEHRTVGPHRAWCHDCSEWCYPQEPCRRCHGVSEVLRILARGYGLEVGNEHE